MKKRFSLFTALLLFVLLLSSCGGAGKDLSLVTTPVTVPGATDFVCLEIAGRGTVTIELYPEIAPVTVSNFQRLVSEGFYDGLTFHRVVEGFVIQCGSPTGNGADSSGIEIFGEFTANGYHNTLYHTRGVVSMGRKKTGYNTGSSHFFVCLTDQPDLDGFYAAFGRVIEGMEIVDAIAAVPVNENGKPLTDEIVTRAFFTNR